MQGPVAGVVTIAVGLLLASSAHAQTKGDLAVFSLVGAADVASTRLALSRGGVESNPYMQGGFLYGTHAMAAFLGCVTCRELRQSGHPNGCKVLKAVVIVAGAVVVAHNMRVKR
jgi:hypothetical protein